MSMIVDVCVFCICVRECVCMHISWDVGVCMFYMHVHALCGYMYTTQACECEHVQECACMYLYNCVSRYVPICT